MVTVVRHPDIYFDGDFQVYEEDLFKIRVESVSNQAISTIASKFAKIYAGNRKYFTICVINVPNACCVEIITSCDGYDLLGYLDVLLEESGSGSHQKWLYRGDGCFECVGAIDPDTKE